MSEIDKNNLLAQTISELIQYAKSEVVRTVNTTMLRLYWQIGKTIQEELIKNDRAEYGKRIVTTLSSELVLNYGRGYGERNLWRMIAFYNAFPDAQKNRCIYVGWTNTKDKKAKISLLACCCVPKKATK